MKRRLLNLLAAVSLVLCVATAALWVRSERDYLDIWHCRDGLGIASCRGRIQLMLESNPSGRAYEPPRQLGDSFLAGESLVLTVSSYHGRRLDLRLDWRSIKQGYVVMFPHWLLLVAFAVPATPAFFVELARRRRRKSGCCASCGYDLRATPERCPECGTVPRS